MGHNFPENRGFSASFRVKSFLVRSPSAICSVPRLAPKKVIWIMCRFSGKLLSQCPELSSSPHRKSYHIAHYVQIQVPNWRYDNLEMLLRNNWNASPPFEAHTVKIVNALLRLLHLARNEILEMEMGPTKKLRTVDQRKNKNKLTGWYIHLLIVCRTPAACTLPQ